MMLPKFQNGLTEKRPKHSSFFERLNQRLIRKFGQILHHG